jgi:hypothetical protein
MSEENKTPISDTVKEVGPDGTIKIKDMTNATSNPTENVSYVILTDTNGDYHNGISLSGIVRYGAIDTSASEYQVLLNITNIGNPFSYNQIQAAFDNGNGQIYFETITHKNSDKNGTSIPITIEKGQTVQEKLETSGNEKDLLANSTSGKLALHISFYLGSAIPENAVASFHTALPSINTINGIPAEIKPGEEKSLEFADFITTERKANLKFNTSLIM